MRQHRVAETTHTLELRQVRELNSSVRRHRRPGLTADGLGVTAPAGGWLPPRDLPPDAVLRRVTASGSPSFPYVYGIFAPPEPGPERPVLLHTEHLRAASRRLGLRHRWGC